MISGDNLRVSCAGSESGGAEASSSTVAASRARPVAYGESSLLDQQPSPATVTARGAGCRWLVLDQDTFVRYATATAERADKLAPLGGAHATRTRMASSFDGTIGRRRAAVSVGFHVQKAKESLRKASISGDVHEMQAALDEAAMVSSQNALVDVDAKELAREVLAMQETMQMSGDDAGVRVDLRNCESIDATVRPQPLPPEPGSTHASCACVCTVCVLWCVLCGCPPSDGWALCFSRTPQTMKFWKMMQIESSLLHEAETAMSDPGDEPAEPLPVRAPHNMDHPPTKWP